MGFLALTYLSTVKSFFFLTCALVSRHVLATHLQAAIVKDGQTQKLRGRIADTRVGNIFGVVVKWNSVRHLHGAEEHVENDGQADAKKERW